MKGQNLMILYTNYLRLGKQVFTVKFYLFYFDISLFIYLFNKYTREQTTFFYIKRVFKMIKLH